MLPMDLLVKNDLLIEMFNFSEIVYKMFEYLGLGLHHKDYVDLVDVVELVHQLS